jgi:hypothetical protein
MKRTALLLCLGTLVAVVGARQAGSASTATDPGLTNPKHFFWAQGQYPPSPDALMNDVLYHGGNAGSGAIGVLVSPAVYLVYWGTEWAQGFTTADTDGTLYSSKTLQTYLTSENADECAWYHTPEHHARRTPVRGAADVVEQAFDAGKGGCQVSR